MPFPQTLTQRLHALPHDLLNFPWRNTARVLLERYREDRLGQTASSLTFTTLLALVPFVTVALALFTAFPIFAEMQEVLQKWLMQSLIPESIGQQVQGYLTQFAAKASGLGAASFSFLIVTALSLILTMDRTLNTIWRVPRLRPLGQRVLIYWAAITLGPLVLAGGLALTMSAASAASHSLRGTLPGGVRLLFGTIEFLVMACGVGALYRYVPNTQVQWRHALAGGVFVALCLALAKKGLGMYLASVPTYSVIYGTFATLPILLLWIYIAWIVVLLGAVVAAYLPSLLAGVARKRPAHGGVFLLAVELLQLLHAARGGERHGLTAAQMAHALLVDDLQLVPVLDALTTLDWVAQVNEQAGGAAASEPARYVLLADPATTHMEPLVRRLLIDRGDVLERFWAHTGMEVLKLADVLQRPE
ncbi:YihY family inner membrane protein [Comamonas faecalis]|uniref:UPF0761 membrane protein GCM10022279_16580 n=1 Tax=Comamonas faecalis TaxID=1387849 RepID=A0ABP7R7Q7_9BURK